MICEPINVVPAPPTRRNAPRAISLFSCGGIGDLALHAAGIETILSNELVPERHETFKHNFPTVECLTGDVWQLQDEIVARTRHLLGDDKLDVLYATPPCQGMSKNGRGKLLNAIRAGIKPEIDERNLLIIPTMRIAQALRPVTVILENVPEMQDTAIPVDGQLRNVIEFVAASLGKEYVGRAEVVEFADYGVPQCRQRLITIFSRHPSMITHFLRNGTFLPPPSHSARAGNGRKKWVTLRDAIGKVPSLDAVSEAAACCPGHEYHKVPILDAEKYFWVSNTPPGKGAFDNQCVKCGYKGNPTHGCRIGEDGINRTFTDTPIRCLKCGELLPRPWVREGDDYRLMKGFTSAYKRMDWDSPAPALTRNYSYACSDNKLHPVQNRVLSTYEAMIVHTITDFDYEWKRSSGKKCSEKLIRELIGESIPPRGLKVIMDFLVRIITEEAKDEILYDSRQPAQLTLFDDGVAH